MLRLAVRLHRATDPAAFMLFVAMLAAACGAGPTVAPTGLFATPPAASPGAVVASPIQTPEATPRSSSPAKATPRPSPVAATPASFWAAVVRGLSAAKHLQVTIAGPNAGTLRYQPSASATLVAGQVAFVCTGGAAYDGQSGFARVPGTWECGTAALVAGFRRIGQPADSWNETSPTDSAVTEAVKVASDGTWTWTYAGTSPFLGGQVTASVRLDATSGRILDARRVDPTGTSTYSFDYAVTFPALAVPR
jgi:hypothetical protein